MKTVVYFFIVISCLLSHTSAFSRPGTKKKVAGVFTIAGGATASAVMFAMGFLAKSCSSYDEECDRQQHTGDMLWVASAATMAVTVPGGIYLIHSGFKEAKAGAAQVQQGPAVGGLGLGYAFNF